MATRPARTLVDGVDLSQHVADAHKMASTSIPGGGRVKFVVRYTTPDTTNNPGKQLKAPELATIRAAGLAVCVVSETTAGRATAGYTAGRTDARTASAYCKSLGMPADMPIHWAADEDFAGAQVDAYARGWVDEIGLHRVGAYGGIKVISYLYDHGLITYGWQAYAWSLGKLDPRATAYQWKNGQSLAGNEVDFDAALAADYGQWEPGQTAGDVGVDMPLTQADADLVAATLKRMRVDDAGPPPSDPKAEVTLGQAVRASYFRDGYLANTAVPQVLADEATAAAAIEAIHAQLASLPAVIVAALPEGGPNGLTKADVQDAAARAVTDVMARTTAALAVAPPPAPPGV